MVKKLFSIIRYYCIVPLILLGVALFFLDPLLLKLLWSQQSASIHYRGNWYYLYGIAIDLTFAAIWFYITFTTLRARRYKKLTGRDYGKDHAHFHRTYHDLVKVYQNANPYIMDSETLPEMSWRDASGVILGKLGKKLVFRPSAAPGNLCVFGLPGTNKTTSQIIPTALKFGGSVLAIDIKGDILSWTKDKRNIRIFNPEDPTHSCHFNIFQGIENLTIPERCLMVESIYEIFCHDPGTSSDGNYFVQGGKDWGCGITLQLLHEDINTPISTIRNNILQKDYNYWGARIEAGDCEEAKEYIMSYKGSNEKNVAGCYNLLATSIRTTINGSLNELLDGKGECISAKDLEDGIDIYLEIPQDKISLYAPICTIIVQNFLTAFMRRKDNSAGDQLRPIIFLLDEFPQLRFQFETLSAALSTLRSKGVTLFLAQQSIAQLENRYGESRAREIIDTCSYISIMKIQDPKSREWAQKLIGRERMLKRSTSLNKGHSNDASSGETVSEVYEYIYEAADFGYIGPDGDDVIIYANGKYIQAQKTKCYE